MAKMKVFIADDHALVREGIKLLISAQPDMEVIGEAGDGQSAARELVALGSVAHDQEPAREPLLDGVQAVAHARHGGLRVDEVEVAQEAALQRAAAPELLAR